MELKELVEAMPGFAGYAHVEKIKVFAWYLHTQRGLERVNQAALRECYDKLHYAKPSNVSPYLTQLVEKKPPEILKDSHGYKLEGRIREKLDRAYGQHESTIAVDKMLSDLPGKVSDDAERVYLAEALTCYRHKAFRATIVMTWNLAYDHLLDWILGDPYRLAAFNTRLPIRFPKKQGLVISKKEDFEDLKESEVIQVSTSANLFSKNIGKVLESKLDKRNMAAHPSMVEFVRYQAEDAISDLVNNVILKLK